MSNFIQEATQKGIISFDAGQKNITYIIQKKTYNYEHSEEKVRCLAYLELVFNYGYKPENIDFEVAAKQGSSGKTRADIVIYYPNETPKKAFFAIEVKAGDTSEKEDEVRKQARSYARSEEISTNFFAYKIGDKPFRAFKINGKDTEIKIPYEYNKDKVFAYLVEGQPVDESQAHYEKILPSTPHELKRVFSQCHNIIWQSGEKNKQKSLDEFNKLLFLKMYDELEREKHEKHLEKYEFQVFSLETQTQLKNRLDTTFEKACKERKVEELLKPINLDAHQIYDIVEKLQGFSLLETDKDPKGLAFETFVENYMKGDFGQFFTPRNIVEFMVNISPVVWDKNFDSKRTFLDPCCGSGSFVTQVISSFKEKFKNKQNHLDFTNNSVFGCEINGDIAISAKVNFALHDNGHDNIKNANGLNIKHFDWKTTEFDLILTNPPFGGEPIENKKSDANKKDKQNQNRFYDFEEFEITKKTFDDIDLVRGKIKEKTKFADSVRPEYIFLELFYKVLKDDGIVQVIVPDGLLTNSSVQNIRDFMLDHFKILAVISLPQYTFSHYGAGVKTSILVLKKLAFKDTQMIQATKQKHLKIAIAKHERALESIEKQKLNLASTYEPIIAIQQQQAEQARVTNESGIFNSASTKELLILQKEADKQVKQITETSEFKAWKKEQDNELNEKINDLKEVIYLETRENFTQFEPQLQYPIFMAVAEHIGYDATGRPTEKDDLIDIKTELIRFLTTENANF